MTHNAIATIDRLAELIMVSYRDGHRAHVHTKPARIAGKFTLGHEFRFVEQPFLVRVGCKPYGVSDALEGEIR